MSKKIPLRQKSSKNSVDPLKAQLPNFFAFRQATDLLRVGRDHDGGYLISQADIERSEVLIGLGLNDDWSFEEHFTKLKDVEVITFDRSLNFRYLIKRSVLEFMKNPFNFYGFKKFYSYKKFFRGKHRHVKTFVGLNTADGSYCTLRDIMGDLKETQNIFFKVDIEGYEYRLLNDLLSIEKQTTGLVIEFHDCDLHLAKIKEFITQYPLNLVHIHANNYAPLRLDDSLPLVLELTFSRRAIMCDDTLLPHPLDMSNNPNDLDYELTFTGRTS